MKQILNNWSKINQSSKMIAIKQVLFNQILLKQNCLLCSASFGIAQLKTLNNITLTHQNALCQACLKSLPWQNNDHCPQCGLRSDGNICGSCLNSAPHFDAVYAIFNYDFPVNVMMQRYKYQNMLSLSRLFGQMLNEKVKKNTVDLIIPMPMHPQRLKLRGFNQALEIARFLTAGQQHKLDYTIVARQTLTPPQASLPLKERVKNIKGAFRVDADLTGKKIAIVDDVMTTGASLNEMASTLKKAGASQVECWVVARTLPHT